MTYNQFKCCLVFCKYFEGNTYGPIVNPGSFKNGLMENTKLKLLTLVFCMDIVSAQLTQKNTLYSF